MSDQTTTLQLEIPSEIAQQDVWDLEERLNQVNGITTDLREPKNLIATTLLFIHVVGPYIEQAATVAGGIKSIADLSQIIYDFLHSKKEVDHQQGKNKVVIITKGKRIELYNLTQKEIERVLEEQ